MIEILSISDYLNQSDSGDDVLSSPDYLIPIKLREEIQKLKFPTDASFYNYCWKKKAHWCEECGAYLSAYSASFISHILTKGAHTEKRRDPRNVNILCLKHHHQWEFGKRKEMEIYQANMLLRDKLILEYGR